MIFDAIMTNRIVEEVSNKKPPYNWGTTEISASTPSLLAQNMEQWEWMKNA